eukprot:9493190-Pyramimonas_sp.AAC.1
MATPADLGAAGDSTVSASGARVGLGAPAPRVRDLAAGGVGGFRVVFMHSMAAGFPGNPICPSGRPDHPPVRAG